MTVPAPLTPPYAEADCVGQWGVLSLRAFGVTIAVRVSNRAMLDALPPYLPYGWKPVQSDAVDCVYSIRSISTMGEPNVYVLYRAAVERLRASDFTFLLDELEREIRWEVASNARHRVFVHAGVVGVHDRALILLGSSGAGKSTLVRELVQAGATYYSDEYAVLDRRGRVHPFATDLHMRTAQHPKQVRCSVESIGGHRGKRPLPVALVVATQFQAGAVTDLTTLTPGRGVLKMLQGTAPRSQPDATLQTLERVAVNARILEGRRGEASECAAYLVALLQAKS